MLLIERRLKIVTLVLIAVAAAQTSAAAAPDCSLRFEPAERAIKAIATRDQGHEYCQYRHYETTSDLDGDKRADLVLTFAVEGVNGSNQGTREYLLIFPSTLKYRPISILAGEIPIRQISRIKEVRNRKIKLDLDVYMPADSICCPSGKGMAVFELRKSELVELKGEVSE